MTTAYSVFATIPRAVYTQPAAWAPVPGVRESEHMVRDSGVPIGVFEPIYLRVSSLLFSDYYYYSTLDYIKSLPAISCLISCCA